jgi:hypothetical protein
VKYTAEQFKAKLRRWSKNTPKALQDAMDVSGKDIVKDVQKNRLSGQVLKQQTGTLWKSIHHLTRLKPGQVVLKVGTPVPYGAYWEEGRVPGQAARPFLKPSIRIKRQSVINRIADAMMKAYKSA